MNLFKRYPELRAGIVNLGSGTVFKGVIWKVSRDFVILRNAELLQDREQQKTDPRAVDGEIFLFRDQIDFMQLL